MDLGTIKVFSGDCRYFLSCIRFNLGSGPRYA